METKKYKLVSVGSFTLTLRGTYREVVNDALGRPIAPRTVAPLQFQFNNGVPKEVDQEALELIKQTAHWGNDLFYHPASVPKEESEEVKSISKRIGRDIETQLVAKRDRRIRAREGVVDPTSGESFE